MLHFSNMHLGRIFFIIKLWKWKSRFFKMSAPSAYHLLDPSNINITKSSKPAWFLVQFWIVCVKQKASASPSSFQWLNGAARPLHRRRRRRIRRQSLLGLDSSLNCTNILPNCTSIAAFLIPNWATRGIWSFPSRKMSFFIFIILLLLI